MNTLRVRLIAFGLALILAVACGAPPRAEISNTPTAIATGNIRTWAVAADAANIYWTDCGDSPAAKNGKVLRAAKTGGAPIALASGEACPTSIALDATHVYWLGGATGTTAIARVAKTGGAVERLARGSDVRAFAVDDANVYWTECLLSVKTAMVLKQPKSGGEPVQVAWVSDCANDLAVDDTGVFWIDSLGIRRVAKTGGEPVTLAPPHFQPRNLVLDDARAYWIGGATIFQVPKTGGAISVVVSGQKNLGTLAVDTANVYWTTAGALMRIKSGDAPLLVAKVEGMPTAIAVDDAQLYWTTLDAVMRVSKWSGAPVALRADEPQILAAAQEGLNALAVDDAYVYWATCRYEPEKYGRGTVARVSKNGGTLTVLASNQQCPGNLVLDATHAYWIVQGPETGPNDYRRGAVMRVSKTGGEPVALATNQNGRAALAVDEANVYWTVCGVERGIFQLAKSGGAPTLIPVETTCPNSLAVDATHLYWHDSNAIVKMAKPSGARQIVVTSAGGSIAVDAAAVYWARTERTARTTYRSCAEERSALYAAPKDGRAPTRLAETSGYAPSRIVMDETHLFWANDCTNGIVKIPKTGGAPIQVISNITAQHLAVDATSVYWTVYPSGMIVKGVK